jgi:YcaO-like protein with predicted kinase domain
MGLNRKPLTELCKDYPTLGNRKNVTQRTEEASATLCRVEPLAPLAGVTRVADVTGLDRIGIPVFSVTRPNSRSLSVAQGKGLDLPSARASALMEALELHHAERLYIPSYLLRFADITERDRVVDVTWLPRRRSVEFDPYRTSAWTEALDLIGGEGKLVPLDLVHTDFTASGFPGSGSFVMSSNGLASGNTYAEAVVHATCELIERDAYALAEYNRNKPGKLVDLDSITFQPLASAILNIRAARCDLELVELTSDIGVPVFFATITQGAESPITSLPAGGLGCHPNRTWACARAITEAAQARLTRLVGSRDDLNLEWFRDPGPRKQPKSLVSKVRLDGGAEFISDTPEEDFLWLKPRLVKRGLCQILVVDLGRPEFGLPVTRVWLTSSPSDYTRAGASCRRGRSARSPRDSTPMSFDQAVVFLGPTMKVQNARGLLNADFRPPAMRGDVYLAARDEPRAILIIDGAFGEVPSVFHKEILWALSQGIHVFGSSSLGALRAAEMAPFGMIGVGRIYEAYRDGTLDKDDAVAVLHGPEDLGWPTLTCALVDIDATLTKALSQGLIEAGEHSLLRQIAERTFWRERTYAGLLDGAQAEGMKPHTLTALRKWLRVNQISQKERDANDLLRLVRSSWAKLARPNAPSFHMESTAAWQKLKFEFDWKTRDVSWAEYRRVQNRLSTRGTYKAVEMEALAVFLAEKVSNDGHVVWSSDDFEAAASMFRQSNGLATSGDVRRWMEDAKLNHGDYLKAIEIFHAIARIRSRYFREIAAVEMQVLRWSNIIAGNVES